MSLVLISYIEMQEGIHDYKSHLFLFVFLMLLLHVSQCKPVILAISQPLRWSRLELVTSSQIPCRSKAPPPPVLTVTVNYVNAFAIICTVCGICTVSCNALAATLRAAVAAIELLTFSGTELFNALLLMFAVK